MRCRVARIALVVAAVGLTAAGCKNSTQMFEDNNEGGWFSKRVDVFDKPSWARATGEDQQNVILNPRGVVDANELVGADGSCGAPPVAAAAPEPAPAAAPTPAAERPVGTVAGDYARAPMLEAPQAAAHPNGAALGQPPGGPLVMGGIALGMTECDVVRRAGLPGNINIGAGDKGERKVVLTYLSGSWPGIYTFDAGRLKVVDRAPVPETPVKPAKKQKQKAKTAKPKTATREVDRDYVQ